MPTTSPILFPLPLPPSVSAPPSTLHLTPVFNPTTTGTALWPSARLLSTHLLSLRPRLLRRRRGRNNQQLRVLDLGSGLGLVALAAAAGLGAFVAATDVGVVASGVLTRNVRGNSGVVAEGGGRVEVRVLDWFDALAGEGGKGGQSAEEEEVEEDAAAVVSEGNMQEDDNDEEEKGERDGEKEEREHWDWITTSDTLYHEPLIPALMATIDRCAAAKTVLWLAFERRDPQVEARALEELRRRGWKGRRVRVGTKVVKDDDDDEEEEDMAVVGGNGSSRKSSGRDGDYDVDGGVDGGVDQDGDDGLEDCEVWRWERVKQRDKMKMKTKTKKAGKS